MKKETRNNILAVLVGISFVELSDKIRLPFIPDLGEVPETTASAPVLFAYLAIIFVGMNIYMLLDIARLKNKRKQMAAAGLNVKPHEGKPSAWSQKHWIVRFSGYLFIYVVTLFIIVLFEDYFDYLRHIYNPSGISIVQFIIVIAFFLTIWWYTRRSEFKKLTEDEYKVNEDDLNSNGK